jgi:hypothetical protein
MPPGSLAITFSEEKIFRIRVEKALFINGERKVGKYVSSLKKFREMTTSERGWF